MIELIRDPCAFDDLHDEWNELYRRSGCESPFLSHAWLSAWLHMFGGERHVAVVLRQQGRLAAGLVAREAPEGLYPLLEHTYWSDVLDDGDEALGALLGKCADRGLRRIEVQAPHLPHHRARLERVAQRRFVLMAKHPWNNHCIALTGSFEDYLAERPSKVRSELRRKLRRFAAELPEAELACFQGASECPSAAELIAAVERDSWKDEARTAIHSSARDAAFYRRVLRLEEPEPRVYVLASRGEPLAFALGIMHLRRLYVLKTSYRETHKALSPGLTLFCNLIERLAAERSADAIELLGRDSRWKRELATGARPFCTYSLLASAMPTRLYSLAYDHLRPLFARTLAQGKTKS